MVFPAVIYCHVGFFVLRREYFILQPTGKRKLWVVLSLCINLGMLGYFKYFNFLLDMIASVTRMFGYQFGNTALQSVTYQPLDIFLPVGISFSRSDNQLCDRCLSGTNPPLGTLDRLCFLCIVLSAVSGRTYRPCPRLYSANL